jgi:ankyrin repeat protein
MFHPTVALPARPDLEHYKTRAKELLAASKSGDRDAIRAWATEWLQTLVRPPGAPPAAGTEARIREVIDPIASFAEGRLATKPTLSTAQFVMARVHGFDSWPKFGAHVRGLARGEVRSFESAVDAILEGDVVGLRSLLASQPQLARARSTRTSEATLLHYTAANGVESYRQKTPSNIVEVATTLLDAGAEVDAPHEPHGSSGPGTALGLVATSEHPARAGVQLALLERLRMAGANLEGAPGGWVPLESALAQARPEAAAWLADHGARVTIVGAAGLGRRERVSELFDQETPRQRELALISAATYGHLEVMAWLLDHGVDVAAQDGQTALHLAAHGGHLDAVRMLLARGAPLEVKNQYGGTVLDQALWSAAHDAGGWGGNHPGLDYAPIVEALVVAGARIEPGWSTGIAVIDELLRRGRDSS